MATPEQLTVVAALESLGFKVTNEVRPPGAPSVLTWSDETLKKLVKKEIEVDAGGKVSVSADER